MKKCHSWKSKIPLKRTIVCITGLPGVGKSTVSKLIEFFSSEEVEKKGKRKKIGSNCLRISTDEVRYGLYNELVQSKNSKLEAMKRDFTKEELKRTYCGLSVLFDVISSMNPNAFLVADGTFRTEHQRGLLKEVALKHKMNFVVLKVCSDEIDVLRRLEKRNLSGKGSDSNSYFSAKKSYEEPKEAIQVNNKELINLREDIKELVSSHFQKLAQ